MSWGIKISILYIGFVILVLSMVGLAMREKEDLVSKDYYDQEIKYQGKIDKINRTASLKEPLVWEVKQGVLTLRFPEQFNGRKINGRIYFFRPSDAEMDKTVLIPADTSATRDISIHTLKRGLYKMQISWEVNKDEYYNEGIIQLN